MIPFHEIRLASAARSEELCRAWLPDGRRQGQRWVARNPTRRDRRAGSFSVDLRRAIWKDFATGDGGGDLISLYAYVNNIGQAEAARRMAEELGIPLPKRSRLVVSQRQLRQDRARLQEEKMRARFWRLGRLAALESAKAEAVETGDVPLLAVAAAEEWELHRATGSDLLDHWRTALVRDAENATAYEAKGREDTEQAAGLTGIAVAILAAAERHARISRSPVEIRRKAA